MRKRGFHHWLSGAVGVASALSCAPPVGAETPAGTVITNVAALLRDDGVAVRSNPVTLIVAERLDVRLRAVARTAGVATAMLTNAGSGQEVFALAAMAADGAPPGFAIDSDGDGRYDPARDTALPDARTPPLAPGEAIAVFVLAAGEGALGLTATAASGSGAPGTAFADAGDGGGDAVVGPTGARASVTFAADGAELAATLDKRASVRAPDGSDRASVGAVVEFAIVARFPGGGADAEVVDPIPVGTRYQPGSLSLDGAPLSDAADSDRGAVAADGVRVVLGDQPAGAVRTIRFRVILS